MADKHQIDYSGLPRVNWGALLMPAIWGPAHGQWITILFYPLWLFADTALTNAVFYGGLALVLALIVISGSAAITIYYGCTAGFIAYKRVADRVSKERFLAQERKWVVVSAIIALLFLAWASWYNLAIRLPAGPPGQGYV